MTKAVTLIKGEEVSPAVIIKPPDVRRVRRFYRVWDGSLDESSEDIADGEELGWFLNPAQSKSFSPLAQGLGQPDARDRAPVPPATLAVFKVFKRFSGGR